MATSTTSATFLHRRDLSPGLKGERMFAGRRGRLSRMNRWSTAKGMAMALLAAGGCRGAGPSSPIPTPSMHASAPKVTREAPARAPWCLPLLPPEASHGAIAARVDAAERWVDECLCPSVESSPEQCSCMRLDLESGIFGALSPAGAPRPSEDGLTRRPAPRGFSARLEDGGAAVCRAAIPSGPCAHVRLPVAPVSPEGMVAPNPLPSVSDDGATLAITRPAPTTNDLARRVVEIYDVPSSRRLRTIAMRNVGYASGLHDGFFVGSTLLVLESGSGPPVIGWLYEARSGRALAELDANHGLYPAHVRDDLWAFADGAAVEWRQVSTGRRESRLALDGDENAMGSRAIATVELPRRAELLVLVSGTSTTTAGTVFAVDLKGARLRKRFSPPPCLSGTER